jgi:outer membrane protein assembly factor BamA
MKKVILLVLFLLYSINCLPQNTADSVKKGWDLSYLPAIAFDSDLGLMYGIILNPYDYGNGFRYPDYVQQFRLQLARLTRGSSDYYLDYDSFTLLPGTRFLAGIRYVANQAYPFYGFNGNESCYNHSWEVDEDTAYRSRMFYRQDRKVFQLYANIQDTIGKSKFQWHIGWSAGDYDIDTVNITKLNRKLDADKKLRHIPTLYERYTDWGIIKESERNGGFVNSVLVGLIYDSRNRLTNPDKGIYTELNVRWMPFFLSKDHFSGLNIGLIHKQYLGVIKNRLTFAYRIWLNTNLEDNQAYYTRQLLTTFLSSEGYGGVSTIRGVLMNRIMTGDFILGNFELRSRLFNARLVKQNWYLGVVAFMDAGRILKPVKIDMSNVPPAARNEFFRGTDKTVHKSLGGGLKIVKNENFVFSAEFAKPFDPQDGISGLYIGLDYLF